MKSIVLFLLAFVHASLAIAQTVHTGSVRVIYTPDKPVNRLVPSTMLGAAFDGHEEGEINKILRPENIISMQSVGLHPISYRLRTELGVEAWHWNKNGQWSESGKQEGYWTSDIDNPQTVWLSNGYRLPRRGNTHDQANDDGYSRIDDGDTLTYWKSNPYLDEYYTHEPNISHPQWVILDLGKLVPVNALRIHWGNPYALSFVADYALDIGDDYFDPLQPRLWHSFSAGNVVDQKGGNQVVIISDKPVKVRFVRITMTRGSNTAITGAKDIRDRLGFSLYEMEAGLLESNGKFHDWVKHAANNKHQSIVNTSSTDPWHRATDIDVHTEQSGIDRFFTCGITNNQPAMIPVGLLYDTPDNMIALIKHLLQHHYPVSEIEMGEEPEGQLVDPRDYAALYYQWAKAIKKIAPGLRLGGPCFAALSTSEDDAETFAESNWTKIFLSYLREHNSLSDFNFFSFEWYPFDDICAPSAPQLAMEPGMFRTALANFSKDVLPPGTPLYVTEYGYSAHSGRAEVDIEGALMYADILGQFLTMGGAKSFLYGYEPAYLDQYQHCDWGNNMLFGLDDTGRIAYRTAAFYGMQMLLHQWVQPGDTLLDIYPAETDIKNKDGDALVTAYSIWRPGKKQWSLLLINKDPERTWNITSCNIDQPNGQSSTLRYPLQSAQYSSAQYKWKSNGGDGHPTRTLPPINDIIPQGKNILLPPYSLTIVTESNQ